MSDSVEDLIKNYNEHVYPDQHPRSIGLFTIPEYPELEAPRGMWSAALDAILTTLRYLAPATLLTIFWGHQSFLFKILKHIDSAFRAIVFSSEEQKQAVLQWLAEAGPVRVEHLETVWRHGWIICGVLDAALPGACAGHPPTRLSIKHAQAIADHYLGVEPVFSRQELDSNDSLSRHQEWKLATYLDRIRQALSKLTPPVSKPVSQRTSPETAQCILDYVAKGSGLSAIQINHKAYFKVYPTSQQTLDPGEVTILIRGPKDTYGMVVLPPILGKAQMIRQKLLGLHSKQTFTENVLPLTQGATYLRSYGRNDMNKTYYIPKAQYDIEIEVDTRHDHAKISYTVKLEGKYLVSITSRGQCIVGSPFTVTASNNIISFLERDSFCLEDGEEIDIVDVHTDRKVVLRIVDFVTEKMLLKENGTLEKISDDEAKILMTTEKANKASNYEHKTCTEMLTSVGQKPVKKFNNAAHKILAMNRVCKTFNELIHEKHLKLRKERIESLIVPRRQKDIPDIVNSTFTETNVNAYVMSELREKFIVPESISVSLTAEKSKSHYDNDAENICIHMPMESTRLDTPDSLEMEITSPVDQDDDISVEEMAPMTANNPFLNEMFEENYVAANNFGTFVASEYETNNSQHEETRNTSIKIVIDPNLTPIDNLSPLPASINNNPFFDRDVIDFERPKTPVYKIISGEKVNRDEPVFIDPKSELVNDEELGNEFVNPFFMHQFPTSNFEEAPIADFIIGAPVSLPPMLRATTPEPEHEMKSLILTANESTKQQKSKKSKLTLEETDNNVADSVYLNPSHNLSVPKANKKDNTGNLSNFHSLESNLTEGHSNASTTSDSQFEPDQSDSDRNVTPRKDMWDSAYVSIDDNNSSPDSNNNENTALCELLSKPKFSPSDENTGLKPEEISKMGPAEREIWQTCNELKCDMSKQQEDVRPIKWEIKRPTFTPILEESDRSISSGTKDISRTEISPKQGDTDTVSVAFTELNDIYQEYYPESETNSTTVAEEDNKLHSMEVEYVTQSKEASVDSASDISDVKRHEEELEGTISEVQTNVTESVSVSQPLQTEQYHDDHSNKNKVETQFGESGCSNIVMEKKKYWDERIREIEAKSQEIPILQIKRRSTSKQLKHDSLSKRKGKQMIKNFLSAGDYTQVKNIGQVDDTSCKQQENVLEDTLEQPAKPDAKIVEKWKKYWDDKLEVDQVQITECYRTKSPRNTLTTSSSQSCKSENQAIHIQIKSNDSQDSNYGTDSKDLQSPVKQELAEEVFKAFETSPKRFFGTSRMRIMNKIDTFLGKPAEVNTSTTDITMCHESGLVSSRISLFHNMSNTEDLPWTRRKSQSLLNISRNRESQKNITSMDDALFVEQITEKQSKTPMKSVSIVETNNENITEATNLKTKRSRMMQNAYHETLDENDSNDKHEQNNIPNQYVYVRQTIKDDIERIQPKVEVLRKKSFSKSEMDIFNKLPNDTTNDLDKYKSCDELPRINVKSFISLYEKVSNNSEKRKTQRVDRTDSVDSHKMPSNSITPDAVPKRNFAVDQASVSTSESKCTTPGVTPTNLWTRKTSETVSNLSLDTRTSDSYDVEPVPSNNKETTYLSLSDIELEIIESSPDKSIESSPERQIEPAHMQYKNRFKLAKEYFQSLEELREVKKSRKLNECELLLRKQSTESLEKEITHERPQKRVKKNIKSHSLPSSEIAKGWNQLQQASERCASEETSNTRLMKISEKFNVEDLFTDVTEGKLSRQGSLRGIPHKKAVLEAFRSMENVADNTMNSYEISESQLSDFAKEHKVKNAQTYLSEYPYLPTTDPSKYHSRVDIKASGLISLKELKERKPRRNSVPDLRLNPNFTVNL